MKLSAVLAKIAVSRVILLVVLMVCARCMDKKMAEDRFQLLNGTPAAEVEGNASQAENDSRIRR